MKNKKPEDELKKNSKNNRSKELELVERLFVLLKEK